MKYQMLSRLLSKLTGRKMVLDENIPFSYFLRMISSKAVSMVYGMCRLRTLKRVFVHPSAVIKCAGKIRTGRNLNVERGVYIDALSKGGLTLGDNVSFGYFTFLRITGAMSEIGNWIRIGNNVGLGSHGYYGCGVGTLEIGDNCIFGNYVSVHPENHNFADLSIPIRLQGVNSNGGGGYESALIVGSVPR